MIFLNHEKSIGQIINVLLFAGVGSSQLSQTIGVHPAFVFVGQDKSYGNDHIGREKEEITGPTF